MLKFSKDRHRWLQWLFEAKKRYGLIVLNYTVTSNHIHLLVYDTSGSDVIPRSMQLVAGRTGQEFNQRKKRKGAFWEDRYHATIIEGGNHLVRCIVYIDINMVRAGVVCHPEEWIHGGYNEIQNPRRKCALINYDVLAQVSGFGSLDSFQEAHRDWVNASLSDRGLQRDSQWTKAIAVGSDTFVETVKKKMASLAVGRKIRKSSTAYELREVMVPYNSHSRGENNDIGPENTYFWNKNHIISD